MAITKLLRLKEAVRGSPAAHLKANIYYICNPEKCADGLWIGGNAGTSPEIIYQTMVDNKKFWGKEDGSQGFHYVISFPPEQGITEEPAYEIAEEFARELLGERFYYAFAVHNDQHHMHVHITFDSVSKTDGFKFHSPKGDWEKRIQPITDRICKKYGLPILEFTEEKKGKSYDQWRRDQEKKTVGSKNTAERCDVNWYDLIRDDIDQAIAQSETFEEVLQCLMKKGYRVRLGKYLSLHPYGRERAVRSSRLGAGYSVDDIRQRVLAKEKMHPAEDYVRYGDSEEMIMVLRIKRQSRSGWKMSAFQRRYYQRWYNSYLRNKPGRPQPWRTNADVVRVRRLSNAIKYMIDHDMESFEDLEEKWSVLQKQKAALRAQRNALATKLYRRSPLGELARYEKLKQNRKGEPSPQEAKEMASLFLKIEKVMGVDQARALREEIKTRIGQIKDQEKQIREEEKILEDLYMFYFEMPVPVKEKTEERNVRRQRTRVTIHKKLIAKEEDDSYVVKIPGREEMLRIPKEDALLYKSGEILSAFLYEDETYSTYDMNGSFLNERSGNLVKTYFARQKDRVREKGR